MKKRQGLQGHRRVTVAVGEMPGQRQAPAGGWNIGCICGWQGGNYPNRKQTQAAYAAHLSHEIEHGEYTCKRCGKRLQLAQTRSQHRHMCRKCGTEISREWQAQHPEQTARQKRNHHLKKTFGITVEEADALLAQQGGRCAICQEPITDSRGFAPHVDHCHTTGKVRGILCFPCNAGLGSFRDDVTRLQAAIAYLEREALHDE